jgi:uncharacterized protein YqfB (UPF0267 family)
MADHAMKSWTFLFDKILEGKRTADIRSKKDRTFKVGQICRLEEFDPVSGLYTGRTCSVEITHITDNTTPCAMSSSVLDRDYCVLSIRLI